jgi:hypothetical protein
VVPCLSENPYLPEAEDGVMGVLLKCWSRIGDFFRPQLKVEILDPLPPDATREEIEMFLRTGIRPSR